MSRIEELLDARLDALNRKPEAAYVAPEPKATNNAVRAKVDWTRHPLVLVGALSAALILAAVIFRSGGSTVGPNPSPSPASGLVVDLNNAMNGSTAKDDAEYLSKVCDSVLYRLKTDWKSGKKLDTRGEAVALVGNVGYYATNGVFGSKYPGLPGIIAKHFGNSWETDNDGNLKAGDLSAADRATFEAKWKELRDALKGVR